MEASDIKLTTSAEDIYRIMREIKNLKAVNEELQKDIDANHKAQDCLRAEFAAYRQGEAEHEANIRRQADKERENLTKDYLRRTKVLELNERKVRALQDYHTTQGIEVNAIKAILCDRITKKDAEKINTHLDRIAEAWQRFDAVQKQIVDELAKASWDPCKSKMPPPSVKEGAKE